MNQAVDSRLLGHVFVVDAVVLLLDKQSVGLLYPADVEVEICVPIGIKVEQAQARVAQLEADNRNLRLGLETAMRERDELNARGGAGGAQDDGRNPQVLEQIIEPGGVLRLVPEIGGMQPSDTLVEEGEGHVHEHQSRQRMKFHSATSEIGVVAE